MNIPPLSPKRQLVLDGTGQSEYGADNYPGSLRALSRAVKNEVDFNDLNKLLRSVGEAEISKADLFRVPFKGSAPLMLRSHCVDHIGPVMKYLAGRKDPLLFEDFTRIYHCQTEHTDKTMKDISLFETILSRKTAAKTMARVLNPAHWDGHGAQAELLFEELGKSESASGHQYSYAIKSLGAQIKPTINFDSIRLGIQREALGSRSLDAQFGRNRTALWPQLHDLTEQLTGDIALRQLVANGVGLTRQELGQPIDEGSETWMYYLCRHGLAADVLANLRARGDAVDMELLDDRSGGDKSVLEYIGDHGKMAALFVPELWHDNANGVRAAIDAVPERHRDQLAKVPGIDYLPRAVALQSLRKPTASSKTGIHTHAITPTDDDIGRHTRDTARIEGARHGRR